MATKNKIKAVYRITCYINVENSFQTLAESQVLVMGLSRLHRLLCSTWYLFYRPPKFERQIHHNEIRTLSTKMNDIPRSVLSGVLTILPSHRLINIKFCNL